MRSRWLTFCNAQFSSDVRCADVSAAKTRINRDVLIKIGDADREVLHAPGHPEQAQDV